MKKTALYGIVGGLLQGWLNKKKKKNQCLYKDISSNSLNTVLFIQKQDWSMVVFVY